MRKFLALLLLCGVSYYLYAQVVAERPKTSPRVTLPDCIAWRYVARSGNEPAQVQVCLVNGNRWRFEARSDQSQHTLVGVFDGSRFASSTAKATAEILDPRPTVRDFIQAIGRAAPEATEERDGHTCWRFTSSQAGMSMKVWIDTQTHFPVYVEGTQPDRKRFEWHYSILALDLDRNADQYFNTRSTTPLFSNLLRP
jgi:hypothetical protein